MPPRKYNYLNQEMLDFIDAQVALRNGSRPANSIKQEANTVKKLYNMLEQDPRQPLPFSDEELPVKVAEAVEKQMKINDSYIKTSARRLLQFNEEIIKQVAEANKTPLERDFEEFTKSQEFRQIFERVHKKSQIESSEDGQEDDSESDKETEEMIQQFTKRRRT